ncbi:hypothetical protein FHW15_000870 [Terracoccus luteus]|uniref:Uncharacterized protein n=1 Tax=Terracoccus luteus TaxID=53356 RepID=A0A839PUR7_9MICO|nr:hypothetical protein [Terracoccus luteus]MCP2171378.1 hypothetical protein [Terracoccus luteus]
MRSQPHPCRCAADQTITTNTYEMEVAQLEKSLTPNRIAIKSDKLNGRLLYRGAQFEPVAVGRAASSNPKAIVR